MERVQRLKKRYRDARPNTEHIYSERLLVNPLRAFSVPATYAVFRRRFFFFFLVEARENSSGSPARQIGKFSSSSSSIITRKVNASIGKRFKNGRIKKTKKKTD